MNSMYERSASVNNTAADHEREFLTKALNSAIALAGVLSATLIGCSYPSAQRAVSDCTSKGCVYKTAAGPPNELKPTPSKRYHTTTKVASKGKITTSSVATKEAKPASPQQSNGSDKDKTVSPITTTPDSSATSPQPTENAKSIVRTNSNVATLGQVTETSDPVLKKAKAAVASKMEDPASVEFEDMTRAIRKDPSGQPIDTICGHVRGKKTSGAETGKRAFLYLVNEDIAIVGLGSPSSVAANAYRNVCASRK